MISPAPDAVHASGELTWGVGAVSEQLGIAQATLRTWERRYSLGPTLRTAGGHRRYTAHDIERVDYMRRLLGRGVTPREAARAAHDLDTAEVAALVAGDHPGDAQLSSDEMVDAILVAATEIDTTRLTSLFGGVLRRDGVISAWNSVLAPALIRIGEQWSDGRIDVVCEHVASERLAAEMRLYSRAQSAPLSRAGIMLASAEDDMHALPVYALEAALAERGVGCHVLGARLPWSSVAVLAQRTEPDAIFLWATLDRLADPTLAEAVAALPAATRLVLGGPGWGALEISAATRVGGLADAVDCLVDQ